MSNHINKTLTILLGVVICGVLLPSFANAGSSSPMNKLEDRIMRLEEALKKEQEERIRLQQIVEKMEPTMMQKQKDAQEQEMMEEDTMDTMMEEDTMMSKMKDNVDVSIYGRFWPRLTYKNDNDSSLDITDALSRVGISASTKISEDLTAVIKGEWDVDIEANGDFGDARQAYVGLKSNQFGLVAIGKQWDPYYNLIAEVTDIYYHRASPFGYDNEGPFRTDNLVRYAHSFMGFSIDAGMQVNGELETGSGEDRVFRTNSGVSTAPDNVDAVSVGISYRYGPAYLGISYLRQNLEGLDDIDKRDFYGIGGSFNVTEALYIAATYQYIDESVESNGEELNPYTLDVVTSLDLGNSGVTTIAGYFMHDDDRNQGRQGVNLTLIKQLHPSTKVFAEWVLTDFEMEDTDTSNTFSLGLRYDFDINIL